MSDDTEELSGWRLRVRELNEERDAAAQPDVPVTWQRKLAANVGAFFVISALLIGAAAIGIAWSDSNVDPQPASTYTPSAESTDEPADDSPDLDPDVVDAARECVAGGYGTRDECIVGAVISEGGG